MRKKKGRKGETNDDIMKRKRRKKGRNMIRKEKGKTEKGEKIKKKMTYEEQV